MSAWRPISIGELTGLLDTIDMMRWAFSQECKRFLRERDSIPCRTCCAMYISSSETACGVEEPLNRGKPLCPAGLYSAWFGAGSRICSSGNGRPASSNSDRPSTTKPHAS